MMFYHVGMTITVLLRKNTCAGKLCSTVLFKIMGGISQQDTCAVWFSVSQIMEKEEAIPWPGTLAIVHSYIAYKAGKQL